MFVLVDRDQLRELGERLAESFAEGRAEIIGAAALLGGGVLLLLFYAIRGRGAARRGERRADRRRYDATVARARLTEEEQRVLDAAVRAARGERIRASRLVTQAGAFDRVAERLLARERRDRERGRSRPEGTPPLETTLSALRVKLSAHRPALGNVRSTTDLPAGSIAVVAHANGRLVGRVGERRPSALPVRLAADSQPESSVTVRGQVELAVPLPSGLYRVRTVVLRSDGGGLLLAHRERISRIQRREWARGKVQLAAWLVLDDGEGVAHAATLTEVGGGGGTCAIGVAMSGSALAKGKRFVVRIVGHSVALSAEVLRRSPRGLHLGFRGLRDSQRDRVLWLALAGQREAVAAASSASVAARGESSTLESRKDNAQMAARSTVFSPPTR